MQEGVCAKLHAVISPEFFPGLNGTWHIQTYFNSVAKRLQDMISCAKAIKFTELIAMTETRKIESWRWEGKGRN